MTLITLLRVNIVNETPNNRLTITIFLSYKSVEYFRPDMNETMVTANIELPLLHANFALVPYFFIDPHMAIGDEHKITRPADLELRIHTQTF